MTWAINPTITVAGTEYTNLTFNQVSIDYGRSKIFDTPRPGYARLDIANTTNTAYPFKINDSLVIELENASGVDTIIFTGIITDVRGSFRNSDTAGGLGVISLTAVAPMAQMSRIVVGQTAYPAESDADRISRIFTEAGVTVDVVDPAIYSFAARPASLTDAFTLANNYASSVLGAIYETTDGKVGYANESRRNNEVNTNGFLTIPSSSVIINSIYSNENIADVMNLANVSYDGGTASDYDTASQSTYGLIGASFKTELANQIDAESIAATYINLRSLPRKNLSSFGVRLLDPTLSTSLVNSLLGVYFGMPVEVPGLPNTIVPATYQGYVEGWNLSFSPANAVLTLKTSEEAYSYRDMRWQDVDPTAQWEDIDPTAVRTTRTNLVTNPSLETAISGWNNSSANVTISRTTADTYIGTASMQILSNAVGGGSYAITNRLTPSDRFPVVAGDTIYIQAYVKRGIGNRNSRLILNGHTSATTATITEQFVGSTITLNSSTWTLLQFSATFTNAAVLWASVGIGLQTSGAIGDTIYADAIIAEKNTGGYSPYYFDGSLSDIPAAARPELAWTGTIDRSASTAEAYFGTIPDTTWDNVDSQGIP